MIYIKNGDCLCVTFVTDVQKIYIKNGVRVYNCLCVTFVTNVQKRAGGISHSYHFLSSINRDVFDIVLYVHSVIKIYSILSEFF